MICWKFDVGIGPEVGYVGLVYVVKPHVGLLSQSSLILEVEIRRIANAGSIDNWDGGT
jgi:hypothetical protein